MASLPLRITFAALLLSLLPAAICAIGAPPAPLSAARLAPPGSGSHGSAAGPALTPTLSVLAHYVQQVYRDVLGRDPSPMESTTWLNFLSGGGARSQFLQGLLSSPEYFGNLVDAWYWKYLGRLSSGMERSTWVNAMQSNTTDEQVIADILGSTEYFKNHGSTDNSWITALYADLLNRAPTAQERNAIASCLTGQTRSTCALNLLSGPEYRTLLIQALYQKYLRRPPTGGELNNWLVLMGSGTTDEQIAASLAASDEYFNRFAFFYLYLPLITR